MATKCLTTTWKQKASNFAKANNINENNAIEQLIGIINRPESTNMSDDEIMTTLSDIFNAKVDRTEFTENQNKIFDTLVNREYVNLNVVQKSLNTLQKCTTNIQPFVFKTQKGTYKIGVVDRINNKKPYKRQQEVEKLFNEKQELANAVYEALGFNDKEITIGKGSIDHDNYEGDAYPIRINGEYAGRFTITKRRGGDKLSMDKQGFISGSIGSYGIELESEFQGKGYGKRVYLQIARALSKEGITLKSEFFGKDNIGDKANSVWRKLVNEGYAVDKGEYFEVTNPYTPQQKQQALQLYSQYLESLNKPNTNPILKVNQEEQVKKFAELQERLNNKEFLEGAKSVYESTPELQQFGTQEEYNDYIARVSLGIIRNPSSGEYNYDRKEKDIVYHGTKSISSI